MQRWFHPPELYQTRTSLFFREVGWKKKFLCKCSSGLCVEILQSFCLSVSVGNIVLWVAATFKMLIFMLLFLFNTCLIENYWIVWMEYTCLISIDTRRECYVYKCLELFRTEKEGLYYIILGLKLLFFYINFTGRYCACERIHNRVRAFIYDILYWIYFKSIVTC